MGFRCVFFFRVVYILWYVYNCGSFVKWGIVIIVVVGQVVCGAFSETWYGYQIVVDWV